MATKPSVVPRVWASLTNYDTGPFIGSPMKVDPGAGPAASGHRPGALFPTPAEYENYQQNHITDWVVNWLRLGSSTGAADAHIVETAASGRTTLHGLTVNDLASEIAVSISGANSVGSGLPTINVTNTTGAPVVNVQANAAAAGTALSVDMVGAMTGDGISVSASATSSGDCIDVSIPAGSSSRGLFIISESTTADAAFIRATDSGLALNVLGGSNTALQVTAGSGNEAVSIVGDSGTPRALTVSGSSTYCIEATAATNGTAGLFLGAGSGNGLVAQGGSTPGTYSLVGTAGGTGGIGVYGETFFGALSTSRAGQFVATDAAVAIECTAPGNHALLMNVDTTAPTYGAIKTSTQNAAPTDVSSGQLTYVGSTFDSWMHSSFADTSWRAMWSTLGGFCYGSQMNQIVSNASTAVYSTLCTVSLAAPNAPKLAGQRVRITATIRAGLSAATACTLDVQLRDTTAGTTLVAQVGTGLTTADGYYMPAVATTFTTAACIDIEYTIPVAGARTFVLEFKHDAGAVTVTAQGSMVVTGMY